jgi:hypothetical protein
MEISGQAPFGMRADSIDTFSGSLKAGDKVTLLTSPPPNVGKAALQTSATVLDLSKSTESGGKPYVLVLAVPKASLADLTIAANAGRVAVLRT